MIEVKNLVKSFDGNVVLNGISETIEKGEKVVVIGPSGSGKSTFLRCLNLLETPDSGEIWFEGEQINAKKCDINLVRRKMGMVFQHFNLFPHLTVLQNITLAPTMLKLQSKADARSDRAFRQGRHLSEYAFGWTEAAHCNRAVACDESGRDAV